MKRGEENGRGLSASEVAAASSGRCSCEEQAGRQTGELQEGKKKKIRLTPISRARSLPSSSMMLQGRACLLTLPGVLFLAPTPAFCSARPPLIFLREKKRNMLLTLLLLLTPPSPSPLSPLSPLHSHFLGPN